MRRQKADHTGLLWAGPLGDVGKAQRDSGVVQRCSPSSATYVANHLDYKPEGTSEGKVYPWLLEPSLLQEE